MEKLYNGIMKVKWSTVFCFFFLNWGYSCFAMLCYLLLYHEMNQQYVYIYPLFFWISFPLRSSQSIRFSFYSSSLVIQCCVNFYWTTTPLEKGMTTHSNILAWRIHGHRSLAGYSPWGHKESDMTEVA